MPQLNQALRGALIPVTFGSNRVYSQIVWTKNFKAVRQQSSGKGAAKGGGSGGFGAAKGGGAAGQSYEYFWDMIFNFGLVDQPSIIRRGWVGGDPIADDSLNNITSAQKGPLASAITTIFPVHNQADPPDKFAHLKFTEAFFAPGYQTGDANLESWSYFNHQENLNCKWPGTAWVGFKQLDLGQTPSVPQLSFEYIPITGNFTLDDEFLNTLTPANAGGSIFNSPHTNTGFVIGNDDKRYYVVHVNNEMTVARMDTHATVLHRTTTDFQADLTALGFDGSRFTLSAGNSVVVGAQNSHSIWAWSYGTRGDATYDVAGVCYKINESGALEVIGHMGAQTNNLDWLLTQNSVMSTCVTTGVLHVLVSNNNHQTGIVSLGINGDTTYTGAGSFETQFVEVRSHWGADFSSFVNQNRFERCIMSLVPIDDDTVNVISYISQAAYDYIHANPGVNTVWDTTTGPCMLYDNGSAIVDITAQFGIADIKTHADGSASASYYDDYVAPNTMNVGGTCFIFFMRSYTADFGTAGTLGRIRSYSFDGTTATALQDLSGTIFAVADAGVAQGAYPESVQACLDTQNGTINFLWFGHNNPLSGDFVTGVYGDFGQGTDVTPPYIIRQILLSPIFGFQTEALFGYTVTADRIDATSYAAAVQYCVDQGIYVSVTYNDANNLLDILNELVALYGGFIHDPGGIIKFGVVTGVDVPVRTLDNSHFKVDEGKPPIKITKAAMEDGYNKILFNYLDRAISYNQNQVEAADEVDMDFTGPRTKTYPARFVMTGSTAQNICARALWANLYGKDTYAFQLGWKDADLTEGDLVTLVDSFDKVLTGGVRARITNWKNASRGTYEVVAVREFPAQIQHTQGYTQTTSITGGYGTLVQSVAPMLASRAYELPREFQDSSGRLYFGYNQGFLNMGAQLYLSHDGANYVLTQDAQPYILSGLFAGPLLQRPQGYVEQDIEFYMFPTSGFNASTPTFVETYDLDNVTQALRAAGAGVLIVGSEAVSVQDLTLLGQNHYKAKYAFRGWGGTPINAQNSGSYFHYHAAGIFQHEISENEIGTNISYKIAPYNFAGEVYDISSINAQSYTIRGLYWLPRVQPPLRLYVDSAVSWSPSTPLSGPYIAVASGGGPVNVGWPAASNVDGFGAGGFGHGGYGHWEPDATGLSLPDYRVEVQSINGVTVRSTVVYTGWFRYDPFMNSADFNGLANDLIFKVTPYNTKGDGPTSSVASIHMGW